MKRFKRCTVLACLLLIALMLLEVWRCKHLLTVTSYELTTDKLKQAIRLVHLTDLHNSEFGEDNAELIDLVNRQAPDLILMTGDMLNGREEETEVAVNLVRRLTETAPVYFSYGNHEVTHQNTFRSDLTALFEEAGAVMLNRTYEDVTVNGQTIRLGGIYGYCLPEKYYATGEARYWECEFLKEFQNTEDYTLLLAHLPTCWIRNDNLDIWEIDCVLSGHEHGGQIRLPWIGGLYAPDQGFFPGRSSGVYLSEDGKKAMVLSRGLGSGNAVPRFGNVPEVVVVDIVPQRAMGEE
ncbi:MAG: metallophosphoesterase [Candidatus Ventricola sp.]